MTLISYHSRIHFADGVLEEALRSEMEARDNLHPLIIAPSTDADVEAIEQVLAGLPSKSSVLFFRDALEIPTEETAAEIAQHYHASKRDCVIAIGGARTIDLAKISRFAIAHDGPLRTCSYSQSAKQGSNPGRPNLYAIPDTLGLAAAVSPHATVILSDSDSSRLTSNALIPTVTICDPGLTASEGSAITTSAAVESIARCIEAYLSASYHPPAAGMALDGLERAVSNLERIAGGTNYEVRREVMAACLNSSLAQQRGLGPTQAIGNALCVASGRNLDCGALCRVILPEVLSRRKHGDAHKIAHLQRILNFEPSSSLARGVQRIFKSVALPENLSALGLGDHDFEIAADLAATDMALIFGSQLAGSAELLSVLHAVR